jgi:hypothetical protein
MKSVILSTTMSPGIKLDANEVFAIGG